MVGEDVVSATPPGWSSRTGFSTLAAGTAAVVASVGLVADDAAMRTMVAFHRRLAAGVRPAAALAEATAPGDPAVFVCFGAG